MKKYFLHLVCISLSFCFIGEMQAQTDFYSIDKIQNIDISFAQGNWRYMLDSLRYNGTELLAGEVEVNGKKFANAGIRYRDGRSFTPGGRRNGLFIQLSTTDANAAYQNVKAIDLSSALRDPSMVREVIASEIARDYMLAPHANYSKVNINGEYYGLFVNIEVVDENFISNNWGTTTSALFYINPNTGEKEDAACRSKYYGNLRHDMKAECFEHNIQVLKGNWEDLYELTQILNQSPEQIESILDIDKTLWMLAFNNVLLNLYSYTGKAGSSYYLVKDKKGRYIPVLGNLNLAFGSYKNTGDGSDLGTVAMIQLDPMLHVGAEAKPLIKVLLSNADYKKRYISHIRTIMEEHLAKSKLRKRAKEIQKLIKVDLINDRNRYYNSDDFGKSLDATVGKRSRIPGIAKIMESRVSFLKNNAHFKVLPPKIEDVVLAGREKYSTSRVSDFRIQASLDRFTKKVYVYYRFNEGAEYTALKMMDDGKNDDDAANDSVYGVIIQPVNGASQIEFYIMAENAKTITYSPLNYVKEQYSSTLSELNE